MELKVYAIYDEKALVYGVPFFTSTDGLATRMFCDLVSDSNSSVFKHPTDFKLYCIGSFNSADAVLSPVTPRYMACGSDFVGDSDYA